MLKIVIAIGGASGAVYAKILLNKLQKVINDQHLAVGVVITDNAATNWQLEMGTAFDEQQYPQLQFYNNRDFTAPFASGSALYTHMIVCPCSMGLLGRIASGISNDLITRVADVMLKERRRLILVTRETPLSLIHINNMKAVTEAGGIICPQRPHFIRNPLRLMKLPQLW